MARAKRIAPKLADAAESALMQIKLLPNHQRCPRQSKFRSVNVGRPGMSASGLLGHKWKFDAGQFLRVHVRAFPGNLSADAASNGYKLVNASVVERHLDESECTCAGSRKGKAVRNLKA
jgi:hypothetical protein